MAYAMLPAKRAGGQPMKPNPKEKLEAPDLSRGEDVTGIWIGLITKFICGIFYGVNGVKCGGNC